MLGFAIWRRTIPAAVVQLYIAISARAIAPSSLHLAGVYLVECADLAEAVDIAGEVAHAAISFVEVRPVLDDSQMAPE